MFVHSHVPRPASRRRRVADSAAPMVAFSMATVCRNRVIQLVSRLGAYPVDYDLHYSFLITVLPCRLGTPVNTLYSHEKSKRLRVLSRRAFGMRRSRLGAGTVRTGIGRGLSYTQTRNLPLRQEFMVRSTVLRSVPRVSSAFCVLYIGWRR